MKTITLLSNEEVAKIIESSTSSSIAQKTMIPESTIKNYKSGRTNIKDMPISMREVFTNVYLNNSVLDYPQNFAVSDEDWETMTIWSGIRNPLFYPYLETFIANELSKERYKNKQKRPLTYLFLDFDIESPINRESLLVTGPAQGICFIVKSSSLLPYLIDNCTFVSLKDNKNYPKLDIDKLNFEKYPDLYDYPYLMSNLTDGLNYPIAKSIVEYFEEKNIKTFTDMREIAKQNCPDFKIKCTNKFQQKIYETLAKQRIKSFVE